MNQNFLPDTWTDRGAVAGVFGIGLRFAVWYWHKRSAKKLPTTTAPIFGWIARRLESETLLALMTIKYQTEVAKVKTLQNRMEEAGISIPTSFDSPGGEKSSYDLPGSTLVHTKTSGAIQSPNISTPLEIDLDP